MKPKLKKIPPVQTPNAIGKLPWEKAATLDHLLQKIVSLAVSEVTKESLSSLQNLVKIEHPSQENYGDYTTNIALILAGKLKMRPMDIAATISEAINKYIKEHQTIKGLSDSKTSFHGIETVSDVLEKIDIVKPGFINLWISASQLSTQLYGLLEKDNGAGIGGNKVNPLLEALEGQKIAVEYTDPNPFKEFHLGHLYSNIIGESIARMFEACGVAVWRGDFYGDVGMHIAKSIYGLLAKLKVQSSNFKTLNGQDYIQELKKELRVLDKLSVADRQKFLGAGYAIGVRKFEEDKKVAEQIKAINSLVYVAAQEILQKNKGWQSIVNYRQYIKGKEERFPEVREIYEAGLRWSLEYFETIYKRLGTKFDGYYPESWVGELGLQLVEKGLAMGVLEKSDGAVIYKGEDEGLHTRVFVNKLGLPTYEAKDLGLAKAKYQDFPYDASINVFGKEIDEYYKVVRAAMVKIVPELGVKAFYIAHGMVKLPEGKMSSRTGNVITFEWLLDEAKARTLKLIKDDSMPAAEKETISEKVALSAVRYALLKNSLGNDVVFDFDKSVTFAGDSGPYLQYTYARCRSVLRKAQLTMNQEPRTKNNFTNNLQLNAEELALLRTLYRLPEVVLTATRTFAPNLICEFLYNLAQKYNLFYQKHTILQAEKTQSSNIKVQNQSFKLKSVNINELNPQLITYNLLQTSAFRLALTEATAIVLKQGLWLLGIETVERM